MLQPKFSLIHNNYLSERYLYSLQGSSVKDPANPRRPTQQILPSCKICLWLTRLTTVSAIFVWRSYKKENQMLSCPVDMRLTKHASKNGSRIIINVHAVDMSYPRRQELSSNNPTWTARLSCSHRSFSEYSSTDLSRPNL